MTDEEADELIDGFRALVDRLRAPKRALQPATTDERPDLGIKDLISAADGADLARRAKSTMNTWCREHAINGEAGFARQIGKRWFVSRSRLLRHLASGSSD
jgi:hypothetical protein